MILFMTSVPPVDVKNMEKPSAPDDMAMEALLYGTYMYGLH